MSTQYHAKLPVPGPGDLVAFRDTVLTYGRAASQGASFLLHADPAGRDLCRWLGLPADQVEPGSAEDGGAGAAALVDASRKSLFAAECSLKFLADALSLPETPLSEFRAQGWLGETLFAALVRSSYGPDSDGYFPTPSELRMTFDQRPFLEGEARWDDFYLEACQDFFMEELTPVQMVEKALWTLPAERRSSLRRSLEEWETEIHSAVFLVGETSNRLTPIARLLEALLDRTQPVPELAPLLKAEPSWTREEVAGRLSGEQREAVAAQLFVGFEEFTDDLLYTTGPRYLAWRCGQVAV